MDKNDEINRSRKNPCSTKTRLLKNLIATRYTYCEYTKIFVYIYFSSAFNK